MYWLNDKCAAVRQAQEYLCLAGYATTRSGRWSERDGEAVRRFQSDFGLVPTGVIDYRTHTLLMKASNENRARGKTKSNTGWKFPYIRGDSCNELTVLNALLCEILRYYRIDIPLRPISHFSAATEEAVKAVRKIYCLPDTPIFDEILYTYMINDKQHFLI